MEIVFKYARLKNKELQRAEPTFQAIFNVIHSQGDRIFAEYIDMFEVKTVSYKQMKEYVYRMATYLASQIKLPKESFVGMYMENSVD
ncbi:MAG: hypothetical protein MJ233_00735 [Mycoplasmoidaceae bacterium]|nr:hypothetical protein [Mycoplasmoidaceae bacterium]